MRVLVLRSGIEVEKYDTILERAKELDEEELMFLYDTLEDVMGLHWKRAYDVWVLPAISNPEKAEEIWNRYDFLGLTGNPEQKMLATRLSDLNDEFKRILVVCLKRRKRKLASQNSDQPSTSQ